MIWKRPNNHKKNTLIILKLYVPMPNVDIGIALKDREEKERKLIYRKAKTLYRAMFIIENVVIVITHCSF